MNKIVLYTKTYRGDLQRVKQLTDSIKKYNRDNIPFYISIPKSDNELFLNNIDTDYVKIVYDEDIVNISTQNWHTQQIVKSSFWKLELCKNYVMIDSDSYFIKDFYISDFMYDDTTPYTVMHEQKDLFEWSSRYKDLLGFNPKTGFMEDRKKVMETFDRKGRYYDFGPSPTIWSSKVWKSLDEVLLANNLDFVNLINNVPSEFSWYGEYLLSNKIIDVVAVGPLFKVFHYGGQREYYKQLGYTEESFSENYLGIVLQSNFTTEIKY
jgi:hypothetical protein